MTHETMKTFGYPDTLISEYQCWNVVLRPRQATLGALVLICKENATAFSGITPAAFAELAPVVGDIENALKQVVGYDKINYLMLMMVDPHVHFHVLPRHRNPAEFNGRSYDDAQWPGPPNIADAIDIDTSDFAKLLEMLRNTWP